MTTDTYLDQILPQTKQDVKERRSLKSQDELIAELADNPPALDFKKAFSEDRLHLVAEIKRASPSKGIFDENLDVKKLARSYVKNGATAISVLTDSKFFKGSLEDLKKVREVTLSSKTPLLRKDFIIDPYQIYESRAWGADAILLIAVCLSNNEIEEFQNIAESLSMSALIEVHNEEEYFRVSDLKPKLIGINNRDLKTFQTDLTTTHAIAPRVSQSIVVISESGIHTQKDARILRAAGVDGILVGESLITSSDTAKLVQELSSIDDPRNPFQDATILKDMMDLNNGNNDSNNRLS